MSRTIVTRQWTRRCPKCKNDFGYFSAKPTGVFRCFDCNVRCRTVSFTERVRVVASRGDGIMSEGGFTPHFNEGLGQYVESNRHMRYLMKKHGVSFVEKGEIQMPTSIEPTMED